VYQSTIFGTSVRPRAPPKAVLFQTRPVISWRHEHPWQFLGANLDMQFFDMRYRAGHPARSVLAA